MREPAKEEIAKFKRACKALDDLGRAGFTLYLANDCMNLMIGSSHDDNGQKQQSNIRSEYHIVGAGGGDW